MRASRIFALARTMRCATSAAAVRNARRSPRSSGRRPRAASAPPGCRRERGMAAGEDQPQPVVLQLLVPRPRADGPRRSARSASDASKRDLRRIASTAREAAGRHEPGPRVLGDPVPRPLLHRAAKASWSASSAWSKSPSKPDQRREHAARLGAVELVDDPADLFGVHGRTPMLDPRRYPCPPFPLIHIFSDVHIDHGLELVGPVRPDRQGRT
jgi:hypothetical protein